MVEMCVIFRLMVWLMLLAWGYHRTVLAETMPPKEKNIGEGENNLTPDDFQFEAEARTKIAGKIKIVRACALTFIHIHSAEAEERARLAENRAAVAEAQAAQVLRLGYYDRV